MHGFLRGSVAVPPGIDLTAPVTDELFAVEHGKPHLACRILPCRGRLLGSAYAGCRLAQRRISEVLRSYGAAEFVAVAAVVCVPRSSPGGIEQDDG